MIIDDLMGATPEDINKLVDDFAAEAKQMLLSGRHQAAVVWGRKSFSLTIRSLGVGEPVLYPEASPGLCHAKAA